MDQWFFLLRSNYLDLDSHIQKDIYHSFYKFVYPDIYFILRDHSATEDVIQEAFVKTVLKGNTPAHAKNLAGWVKQIARNATIDWLRKNKKNRQIIDWEDVIIVDEKTSVTNEVELLLQNEELYDAIEELKPEHRILIIMFYLEEKTYKEISKELHLTEQIVTQRLARARKKLQKYFTRKWNDVYE